ncbi:MAG TPA: DUF362 domain-containing protein [Thermoanaerobaculia bacterium]|nr:DUF362 domain-containing protein [Thermoanaerobaculia bacterium]
MTRPEPYADDRPTRREALLRLSSAGLAAAAFGGGTLFFLDRRAAVAAAPAIPDWRVDLPGAPRAVAARGPDPAANVRRAIAALGGMERFVRRGESVLVKPNVGWDRLPEQAANTDPRVVGELVRLAAAAGAGRIVVADISCNDPKRCFARSGILAAAAGAEVLDARALKLTPASLPGAAAGLEVIAPLLAADRVINVPIAKHHGLSRVTVGMKNWFGVLGRGRNRLHQGIDRSIAELGAIFRPTLTVVDATRVLLANGPQGGSLADVREVGAVAAGLDPVALDAWGAAQLDVDPRTLAFLAEAEQRGLGRRDLALVRELGAA